MRAVLTDIVIRQAKPGSEIWDMACPTLAIRVGKNRRTWVLKKGNSRQALGHYPQLSLAKARQKASTGILEASESLLDALLDFERIYGPEVAPRTMKDWTRLITKHFTTLHNKPLQDITLRDLSKVLEAMNDTPQEANHAHAAISRLLNWCASTGRLPHTLRLPTPYKKKSRERVLTLEEIAKVWIACSTNNPFHLIVKLLILTGQRRGEIANIYLCTFHSQSHFASSHSSSGTYSHGDCTPLSTTKNNTITWPTTKNGKPHTIPISALTTSMIAQLVADLPHNTWSKPKTALDKASGVTNYTLHDIRRTVATHMSQQLKINSDVIEKILNHSTPGVRGIYNRDDRLEEMADALARWEQFVLQLACPRA